jgi:prepilin-type N-terminal cleavage/methylation domain-containing protein
MLNINRKLSKKGFTLVEVIVAVAILGMASLGIFQSYKVGFWGMSDARARTIATNIAQEKLEEVKSKSLADGTYPDPDNPIVLSGKNFDAVVDVSTIIDEESGLPTTLKKIITTVSWQKRNGEVTNIIVEGLQSKALAPPSTDAPTAILISANDTSINVGENSLIKVTILDQDNYPISYDGQINLTMDPNTLGTLYNDSLLEFTLEFNGESFLTTTFYANNNGNAGDVLITARDDLNELIPDSVTVTIIGGEPKNINLMVDPASILINGDTSTLTVRIEDEKGFLANNWTGTIQLAITSGEGTGYLGDPPDGDTITIDFNEENVKTTLFTSSIQDGVAVITATDQAGILTEDSKTIYISSGPPYQIDIEAEPNTIFIPGYEGGDTSSTITVTIKNETGGDVSGFVGTITLSLLSGSESGYLDTNTNTNPLIFNGESSQSITFTSTTTPGIVEIEATDSTSGSPGHLPLISDTETLTVASGPPEYLEITALPDIILNNGIDSSTLTIVLKDFNGNYSSFDEDKILYFTLSPDQGTVNNTPLKLPAEHSQISTTYICDNTEFEGYVNITVTCEGILEGSTATVQVAQSIIRPSENPNIHYGGDWGWNRRLQTWIWKDDRSKVFFDIEVLGGTIDITQIDLAWKEGSESEKLQRITIKDDASNVKINRTWSSWNYPLVKIYPLFCEINSFSTNQDLNVGTYTVELDYNQEIMNRTIIIQFHGTYLGKDNIYQLEFLSPDMIV